MGFHATLRLHRGFGQEPWLGAGHTAGGQVKFQLTGLRPEDVMKAQI